MRRVRLHFVLPLLLLFAQHGALIHEISHVAYLGQAQGAQLRTDEHLLDSRICATCYAFAQVTSPAVGSLVTLPPPDCVHLRSLDLTNAVISAESPTPRSRGPPPPFA